MSETETPAAPAEVEAEVEVVRDSSKCLRCRTAHCVCDMPVNCEWPDCPRLARFHSTAYLCVDHWPLRNGQPR